MSTASEDARGLASALDGVPVPIVQWDRAGHVTAWNRAAARVFGFSREEAVGTPIDRFLGSAYQGSLTKVWRDFETHPESCVRCQFITRAGQRMLTEWHSVALTASDGAVVGASASVSVPRAAARFGVPQEDVLSLLAGGVAHEFMNVFAVVLSYAKFIESASVGDPRQNDAREIAKSAAVGACLTRHMLSIAGFGSRQSLLDVNATLRAVAAAISYALGGARELSLSTSEEALHVDMDWAEFDWLLFDLALTACRVMPDVERFRISAARTALPGEISLVRIGVAPYAVDEAAEPPSLGAELSSSEARRIAESVGGAIGARGAELFVELPYREAAASRSSNRAAEDVEHTDVERKEVVLVLEDEDGVREALVRVLELAGYEVRAGDSVASARAELESGFVPDLLLCDLSLPDGSSTRLLEWLRHERPELYERAIVLTGGAVTTADRSYIRKNAVRVLNKPVGPRSLLTALAEARGEGRRAADPRSEWHLSASARVDAKEGLP